MSSKRRRKDEPGEPGNPKQRPRESDYTELVLVVHANNLAEAELYRAELGAHGIPAVLEQGGAGVAGIPDVAAGIPVLVPEELADEAAEFIAEIETTKSEGHALDKRDDILDNEGKDAEDLDEKLDEDEEDWDDEDTEDEDEDLDDEDDEDTEDEDEK
ncbi:MAG: hypothetical protein WBD75_07625 [Phycisphaerae bacterium]